MSPVTALGWVLVVFLALALLLGLVQVVQKARLERRLTARHSDLVALVWSVQAVQQVVPQFPHPDFLEAVQNPSAALERLMIDLRNYLEEQ